MATLRDVLISKTTLPLTGDYTYKEHFQSFNSSVVHVAASKIGDIIINVDAQPINIYQNTTEFLIMPETISILIQSTPTQILVDNTNTIQVIIDPAC